MRDILIPAAVVLIIASMVVQLPAWALDFLLLANLALALLLLVTTLFLSEPLKLSSLPTLLLLATLYRLALNISTTRLILGNGYAGEVVEAFGSAVIGEKLVVGAVIFVVITLVQYIVIAKGSERVAEVSARFTLDALPGRQMSVDADVRSGLIDFETARKKRTLLQSESRFYGALDGAMKFVKGDAICGIVIALVNIAGGLAIGIIMAGLDLGTALNTYTRLTVGDGLLSQIPSLLNSLAAGIVVTRVPREDGATLASDLWMELTGHRQAKLAIGSLAVILSLAPGVPGMPLVIIGAFLLVNASTAAVVKGTEVQTVAKFIPCVAPLLAIEIPKSAKSLRSVDLQNRIEIFKGRVFETSGLLIPAPVLLERQSGAGQGTVFLRGTAVRTWELGAQAPSVDSVISKLGEVVNDHAPELVDDSLTRRALDYIDSYSPELVAAVVPQIVSVTRLSWIIRELVRERVSVRSFDLVLQAVAECGNKGAGDRALLEEVRVALRRFISSKYSRAGELETLVLCPLLDLAFMRAERENVTLEVEYVSLIENVLRTGSRTDPIIVTSKGARKLLHECLSLRGLDIPVLAYEEIVPEVALRVIERIDVDSPEAQDRLVQKIAA